MHSKFTSLFALLALLVLSVGTASAQVVMKTYVIASGAAAATNGTIAMAGTIGQPVIGVTAGTAVVNSQGFWYTALAGRTVGVREEHTATTGSLSLSQNYPNPFSSSTKLNVTLPASGRVSLKLFDGLGREVLSVIDGVRDAGTISVTITAEDLSSGRYTAVLLAGGQRRAVTMTVVK